MKKSPATRGPLRAFIADSSSMGCQLMVRALQESRQPIKVVGSATDPVEITKGLVANRPEVAIISADLRNGSITGFRVIREARLSCPHIRIIVLVDSPERAVVVEGFRAGADGVFSRDEPFEMLCKCIRVVCEGQIWARSKQLRYVIEALAKDEPQPIKSANGTHLLTKREEELVRLVAEGLTNRDIGRQLNLTEHTVRNYLFRIFNKLGTSNRLELALYVIKQRGAPQKSNLGNAFFPDPAPGSNGGRSARGMGSLAVGSDD
jgi:DNA-binding NarL/FixJ family response regulator